IGSENDGGRPAPITIAAAKARIPVRIDTHREIAFSDQRLNPRIAVGLFVHDMTPMTPDAMQVENHEFMVARSLRKHSIAPMVLPGDGCGPNLCRPIDGSTIADSCVKS